MRIDNGATDPTTNPPTDATDPLPPGWSRARYITPEQARIEYPTYDDRNQLVNEHNQPADEWLIELCDNYLSQLHAGSWGRMFYITSDDSRRAAAEFLATTIEGVNNARQQRSARG
jgi:hypothetical protein